MLKPPKYLVVSLFIITFAVGITVEEYPEAVLHSKILKC
jgi:hypothetical protein